MCNEEEKNINKFDDNTCEAIHSNRSGINVICCSANEILNEKCKFKDFCENQGNLTCGCFITIEEDFFCSPDLSAPSTEKCKYFKNLNQLTIQFHNSNSMDINLNEFFNNIPNLTSLKLINVPFQFTKKTSTWIKTIERLHIENNKNLAYLPKWFSLGHSLKKLTIKRTSLIDITSISLLPKLEYLKLSFNEISHIHRISFISPYLEEVDLSHNKITRLASHTFSQATQLRYLDMSYNHFRTPLPDSVFSRNTKLKYLSLAKSYLTHLTAEAMIGLENLKTLILSYNPTIQLDIFTLLPLKSLQKLELNWCNLTKMPIAVTQCCHLNTLQLSGNLFYKKDSMPSEVLAMLSTITSLTFDRNPLIEMPYGLFLIPVNNIELIEQILETLIQLPLWQKEPCTPYMWNIHLANSSNELKRKVNIWSEQRMETNLLQHCKQLYESTLEKLELYRELEQNSGCEASRKLRSVRDSCIIKQIEMEKMIEEKIKKEWDEKDVHEVTPPSNKKYKVENYLIVSLATNMFLGSFFSTIFVFVLLKHLKKCFERKNHEELVGNTYDRKF
ncbi:Leucine-rich repeat and Leucine-rich repeat, typical subtype-containing protein [Strongyloides ratti]|uniref:Leucine-rich repeat and Leucine-rich repeat, typical subtype-containing protein n=1 Tax=Strongyloides ratti TaxID=34506 RepID=A0A090LCF1_STRRB|nr:Leucine-rich repeat and Leucine-rich repeat, typical subtype-containing protein [Strongyloides ratti]CEF67447.1 Leucine-rich repeat and Leucine-rich repeat, typical subtype-containing protein [Strongyloides ratti]